MSWAIKGKYRGRTELIDSSETYNEALALVGEYQLAFGPEWSIWVERSYE